MDTSKSSKKRKEWVVEIKLYSGRPDPSWIADDSLIKQLQEIWDSLEPWDGEHPFIPPLGYKGYSLKQDDESAWEVYQNYVVRSSKGRRMYRKDKEKRCEKLLAGTMPKGIQIP
jgi:hypothetical protein